MNDDVKPLRLLTADEAASWCSISVHTLNHLRMHARFAPAIRIGRRCFWQPADLNAWVLAQRERPAS